MGLLQDIGDVVGIAGGITGLGQAFGLFGNPAEDMMRKQYEYQSALMDKQIAANSPDTIAHKYAKAGFNPFVAMGNGAGSSGGQSSLGNVSIPEAAYNTQSSQIGLMTSQVLDNLASAYKKSEEGSMVRGLIGSEIKSNLARAGLDEVNADLQSIEKDLKKVYGKKMYEGELGKKSAQIAHYYAMANLAVSQGNLADAEENLRNLQALLTSKEVDIMDYHRRMAWYDLLRYPELLEAKIKQIKSESQKNVAQAGEASAQGKYFEALTKTEDDLRAGRGNLLTLQGNLADVQWQLATVDKDVAAATKAQRIDGLIAEMEAKKLMPEKVAQDIRRATKENNWYEVNQLLGIVKVGIDAYATVTTAGLNKLSLEQRTDIQNRQLEAYERYLTRSNKHIQYAPDNGRAVTLDTPFWQHE